MQIILLHDKRALLRDDRRPTVTVYPNHDGKETVRMEIEGQRFILREGSPIPKCPELIGHAKVAVHDRHGLRYAVESARMAEGVPYTSVDFTAAYYDMVLRMDRMAREIERLTGELLDVRAGLEPDALGHMNIGGEENE